MNSLKFLCVFDTQISSISNYPNLEGLYMMNCPINSLPDLPKLRKLNASNSTLASIPDTFYRLENLNIDNTTISRLPNSLISAITISAKNCKQLIIVPDTLINIEVLYIKNTLVSFLPGLLNLYYLDISGTSINNLPLDYLPALETVLANGCTLADPFAIINKGINLNN
jgi:Leucine-rich repeat (LRR) protein